MVGKAASSQNALKTGIDAQSIVIHGEDPNDLEALTAEYPQRFHPRTPEQRHFVDCLIRDDWQLRRLAKADAQIWDRAMNRAFELDNDAPLGHAFEIDDKTFIRLQRRIDSTHRSYQRTLHELQRLQAGQPPDQSDRKGAAESSDESTSVQPLDTTPGSSAIGFVPATSSDPDLREICGAGPLTRAGRLRPALGSSAKSDDRHSLPPQRIPQALAEPLGVAPQVALEPFAQGSALIE